MPPAEFVAAIEQHCVRVDTPCGDGVMPWRIWGAPFVSATGRVPAGVTPLVCFHGGSGSWTHWIRNVEHFAARRPTVAPDLPGLGDAHLPAEPNTVDGVAAIVAEGLLSLLPAGCQVDVVAFSWGCTVGTAVCRRLGDRLRSLLLVGPAALGAITRSSRARPLRKRFRGMTDADLHAINRDNLERLMLYDPARIDDLAVYLQVKNTARSRFNSPRFAVGTYVLDAVRELRAPLKVVYGAFDNIAHEHTDDRRARFQAVRPDAFFDVIPNVGHWAQYEWDGFNAMVEDWLAAPG